MNTRQWFVSIPAIYIGLPMLFALLNPEFLLLYFVPLAPGAFFRMVAPFLPFLLLPLVVAFIAGTAYSLRTKASGIRRYASLNALIFVAFIVSAETYKDALILFEMIHTPHDCLHIHTFARSLHLLGEFSPAHAEMNVNGTPHFWSYSEKVRQGRASPVVYVQRPNVLLMMQDGSRNGA